ncbi:unnamed protein product, partial [Effrenium voratum]
RNADFPSVKEDQGTSSFLQESGERWWASHTLWRGRGPRKLPFLQAKAPGEAAVKASSKPRSEQPEQRLPLSPKSAKSTAWSQVGGADKDIAVALVRARSRTESVFYEDDEEKPHFELYRSGSRYRRHITMTERKRNHAAALAKDKAYVKALLKEGREKPEQRKEREQAIDSHWLAAAFAPVPDPWSYLPAALSGPGRLPLARQQVKQVTDVSAISRRSSAASQVDLYEIALEISEIQEALRACNFFHALTASGPGADPPVMNRQAFCHLACAAEGFASVEGGPPRLRRAARHFDSLAEQIFVKGSGATWSGIPLLDCRTPSVENTPMARLFAKIVQDIAQDLEQDFADLDCVAQRGRAEYHARGRVFARLLPQASKYGALRGLFLSQQMDRLRRTWAQDEAKNEELEREREKEAAPERNERSERHDRRAGRARSPKSRGHAAGIKETPFVAQVVLMEAPQGKETDSSGELYAHTLMQMKGETLLSHLFEPEVLRFMAETSALFQTIFKAYVDIPQATGEGHMSLAALVRFCADFGLFPHKVDFKTIQWLYNEETRPEMQAQARRCSSAGSASPQSSPQGRRKRKPPTMDDGFIYQHKWIKGHLAWMSKDPAAMTEVETRSCYILTAMDDWMEGHNLKVRDIFANLDTGSTATFMAQELQRVVSFMDFEDPPSPSDVEDLAGLLARPGAVSIDFSTLEMARIAARLAKESRSRARNCFLKDLSKMSKAESNAYLFFTDLLANLELRALAPESFFRMLDMDHTGSVPVVVIVKQAKSLQRAEPSVWTAAMMVENPFAFIGKNPEDEVAREEFVDMVEEIREATKLREVSLDQKHPLFISSNGAQPQLDNFGVRSFVKVVFKIGLTYLTYYGATQQAQLSAAHKLLWLFVYMHWYFDSSRQKVEQLLRQSGAFDRPPSRVPSPQSPMGRPRSRHSDSSGRRYPKHLPSMRRLLARHPYMFMAVAEAELPDWATPERTADAVVQAAFSYARSQHRRLSEEKDAGDEGTEDEDEEDSESPRGGRVQEVPVLPGVQGDMALEHTLLSAVCNLADGA